MYIIDCEPQQAFQPLKHLTKMKNFVGLLIKISDFCVKIPYEIRKYQRGTGIIGVYHFKKRIDNNNKKFPTGAGFIALRGGAVR